jgi:hypothetical protein
MAPLCTEGPSEWGRSISSQPWEDHPPVSHCLSIDWIFRSKAYAVIGENDLALDWLEKAYSERDGTLVWLKVHQRLDGLRGEPRFRDLLARLRLDS